jgi:glycerol-3-phosphate dehydrogenase (NAD(P)+)
MDHEQPAAPQTIAIIGEGAYGSALGRVITANGYTVRFFDKNPPLPKPPKYPPLADVLNNTTAVILAIPSQFIPEFLRNFPAEYRHLPLISAVKGILNPAIFAGFPGYSILSGPAFAEEMNRQEPTILTATDRLAAKLLATDWLKIELTTDIIGVMACGALKNAYAIGSGFRNLRPNTPEFEQYIKDALAELKTAIQILGGDPATADLACGIGDLVLTCGSGKSRNYQFGRMLAKDRNYSPELTTEGLTTLQSLPKELFGLPLLHQLILLAGNQ